MNFRQQLAKHDVKIEEANFDELNETEIEAVSGGDDDRSGISVGYAKATIRIHF